MEGKQAAAGIDHPRAIPTPAVRQSPVVFSSVGGRASGGWGTQLEPDRKQMWQGRKEKGRGGFSGDGCPRGQSSGVQKK